MVSRTTGSRPRARTAGSALLPGDPGPFARALEGLRSVAVRPELVLEEVPAPTRLAPHAVALSGEVVPSYLTEDDDPAATGRFVLLHDPAAPEPWEGEWRVVTYAKAQMEPEVGQDPLAGQAGWSWLTDAMQAGDLEWSAPAGTVTCVTSESFGALSEREPSVELEIRASWTPVLTPGAEGPGLAGHLGAWGDLLCTLAGLPPLPEGVVALSGPRR
ncbi:DUF3000 domain-containing protein [Ornithinimicrobium humiphilum]|uniref:DUF3000 family protein n=1 Tax=Ornithinimicrobium humiphilum TaxID=125288 RepID=A0A543KNG3_9MICO|nr:DUF3000 domain-containing protein [Ornithinimicrobium humiphilum]TQM96616.1 DUF3000 family protein [Ornithinimicrobium humiphilum]